MQVKDQVRDQLMNGTGEARLAGFSQGNEIIARALRELAEEPGMAEKMKNVSSLNMSGPVRQVDYPSGINYDHLEMASDPVANRLGEAIPDQAGVDARNANYHDTLWGLVAHNSRGGAIHPTSCWAIQMEVLLKSHLMCLQGWASRIWMT